MASADAIDLADELAVVTLDLPTIASRAQRERAKSSNAIFNACLPNAFLDASKKMFSAAAAVEAPAEHERTEHDHTEHDRTCVVCWEADREVRFGCGHAVCCRRCVVRLGLHAGCPVCKEAIDCWVEMGEHLVAQPTYRDNLRQTAPPPIEWCPAVSCRGTRWD